MTQTMSHPNDWAQFYRQISISGQPSPPVDIHAPAPAPVPDHHQHHALDTPSSVAAIAVAPGGSPVLGAGGGRISKPKRRRSRASRRTPTTLLSTDTSNFRAMVQQFTGGPGAHFLATAVGSRPNALNINFGLEPSSRVMTQQLGPPLGMFHGQQQQQHPMQHRNADQRPVLGHHVQDQAYANMLSLDRGASPEFPPRPPFMQ